MAYFTDHDQVKNTFTIGNIDIDLWETTPDNQKEQTGHTYENVMPGDELTKTAVIENTSETNDAYVRVFITMNNYIEINDALDDVYEKLGESVVQGKYDEVFDGFGIQHSKNTEGYGLRGWMKKTLDDTLLYVDYVRKPAQRYQFVDANTFMNSSEVAAMGYNQLFDNTGYYDDALDDEARTYILYLKLEPGEKYTLFDGLNVPADFTESQLKMFKDLSINIYADAIQTENFDTAKDAFDALEAAHHLGWWND